MNEKVDQQASKFFEGRDRAQALFDVLRQVVEPIGADIRVTKSQFAFSHRRAFAWAWTPDRWLATRTAPLVLSVALSRRDESPRWKEVVEPRPTRWMHHLEIRSPDEIDDQVRAWLTEASAEAR